jgi:glycosyltransferase involved in cell wall biosynthesis
MPGRPRVSVIITCYNLADVLPRAVASVDDPDAEIIIVNDASPDDTAEVAARLAQDDGRIKIVTNESNLYLAESLNAGVRASRGRYLIMLDADNELAPGALRTLANTLDADQDVDVAYGSMTVVQEANDLTYTSGWPAAFVYEQQMAHRNQIPSTSMYRRKWHERAGGYRRRCRTAEDADFWCRVTSLGAQPRKVTEAPTLIYHDRGDSMSHVEKDWGWQDWYVWSRVPHLTPWGAPASRRKAVPTLEPAMVTVVIPVGPGHDLLLPDALDSLVSQTYRNWRCVVVDDRPHTLEMQPRNRAPRLAVPPWADKYVTGGFNNGPARARNHGVANGPRTPYVLFLDADDYLSPNALEIMMDAAVRRDAIVNKEYVYSDWIKQEAQQVYKAPDFVAEHLRTNLTHSVTALYPRDACVAVMGFDESLDAWEDWDFVLKLIQAGYCGVHVPYPLLYYRYHTGTRREQLYAKRQQHTDTMRAKWHNLMVENEPMGCGCQGGRTTYSPPIQTDRGPLPVNRDGMTLIEFTGSSAPRTYRGPSGTEYRFGSDSGHRMHYVHAKDLSIFDGRKDFRPALGDADGFVVLEALGPPDRVAALAHADL